jgi:glutathione reductase (NADPH)
MAFARKAFGCDEQSKPDYEAVASAVFSSPPIATVGLSEEEAVEKHANVDVYTSSFRSNIPAEGAPPA